MKISSINPKNKQTKSNVLDKNNSLTRGNTIKLTCVTSG